MAGNSFKKEGLVLESLMANSQLSARAQCCTYHVYESQKEQSNLINCIICVWKVSTLTERTHSGTAYLCSIASQGFHRTLPVLWERLASCWTQREDNRAGHQLVEAFVPTWQDHRAGKVTWPQAILEACPLAGNNSTRSKNFILHRYRLDICPRQSANFRKSDPTWPWQSH